MIRRIKSKRGSLNVVHAARPRLQVALALAFLILGASVAWAEEESPEPPAPAPAPEDEAWAELVDEGGAALRVDILSVRSILGPDPRKAFQTIPGAGFSLDQGRLEKSRTTTTLQDSLRGQLGVTTRPEASGGLVPNIGFRGLNPDRSERVLILEDGVPVGFAPYSVNAAYYVPPSERIARIEVLKGSGQILYGPHTIGAVMNLITPDIPSTAYVRFRALGGSQGYMAPYLEAGTTVGRWGFLLTGLYKRGDGYRDAASFDVRDVLAKVRYSWSPRTQLTVKLTANDSESQNTYLGLTQGMFAEDALQNPAPDDTYESTYYGATATFRTQRRQRELIVNLYGSYGMRDWNRQDFSRNTGFAPAPPDTVRTEGDPTIEGGAIYLRSSFGSRDRSFFKAGIEPRLRGTLWLGGRSHEYEVGVRAHTEYFKNERNNRSSLASSPVTRNRDITTTRAFSAWAHDTVAVTRRLSVSGGVRLEHYTSERRFERLNNLDVDIRGETSTTALIPGLGFTLDTGRAATVFGGAHRGFAPARTSDSIDSTGADLQLQAEESWNFELGIRAEPRPWLSYEATAFYMDFNNQVVPANESGGASTESTNAGETRYLGLELGGRVDLARVISRRQRASRLWLDARWMFLDTENTTPGGLFKGRDLPYAPSNVGGFGLLWELPAREFSAGISATYTGEQFTDQQNTRAVSADGTRGIIADTWIIDLTFRARLPRTRMTFILGLNNLLDERAVASRAPRGTFPVAQQHVFFGLEAEVR